MTNKTRWKEGGELGERATGARRRRARRSRGVAVFLIFAITSLSAAPASAAPQTRVQGSIVSFGCGSPPAGFEASQNADTGYSFEITGDLVGCVYGVITSARFHEGGATYQETADEIFVGNYHGEFGTFDMTEFYTAKLDPSNTLTGLKFARCQHPVVEGSGTGAFEGVTGRLDFKDDTVNGTTTYRGHLKLG